uniref:Ras and Rab interactor 3 n=1 Tax=Molossus molossus TaxID=27622 RepID=A0A7J8K123_MOLMO|nr:Ras and Rab interactor 3 [Molossus molossus]
MPRRADGSTPASPLRCLHLCRQQSTRLGPIPDVDEGEEEEEEEGMGPCLPVTPKNCLSPRGISVLEKLVKTCPVWLQLGLDRVEAARILNREVTGTFLVRQDSCSKHLVLCVHFPALVGSSSKVLEYTIKEEKSSFWDSSLNSRRAGGGPAGHCRDPAPRAPPASRPGSASHDEHCSCEIELSAGNDRLWFVNPIFIEDCGSALPADRPPLPSCPSGPSPATSDSTSPTSKWAPRRPASWCGSPTSCEPGYRSPLHGSVD